MAHSFQKKAGKYFLLFCLLICGQSVFAQSTLSGGNPGAPNTIANAPQRDTNANKSNTNKWKDEESRITYEKLNSSLVGTLDTSLHTFHRAPFTSQSWYNDLGNLGSPAYNLLFTPEDRVGPTLGYHVFDVYRFNVDSLPFFNTTRPYSIFNYMLGSKLEQTAGIMHTQNIRPNWNFAVAYHKTVSPGFYKTERNNHDNAYLSTNYKSLDRHYALYAGMAYNKEQHDENGGLVNDSELLNNSYNDRGVVDVAYQNPNYSTTRSTISNVQRDFTFMLQHSYTWGHTDTTYNADSTQYSYRLIPRFSITHKMEVSTEKHTYKDLSPDSLRYSNLFQESFINTGTGYYSSTSDSVFTQQKWFWIDNKIMLNGYLGKEGHQLKFSAGIGNRYDQFISTPVSNLIVDSLPKVVYSTGLDRSSIVSNYLEGELKKEALHPGEWEYGANGKFFLTGADAGNFLLNVLIGKEFKNSSFVAGFKEQLNSAPYSYTNYENQYTKLFFTFNNESVSQLYATLSSSKLRLSGGVRSYVIGNYIYINDSDKPAQYTIPFTLNQAWLRKVFRVGNFFLDNELVYQQVPTNAPVNVPALMGRHELSYEHSLFKNALKTTVGLEVRYNTAYHPAGYDALLNRFYYQNNVYIGNAPVASVFVNFRIKRFRAFVMADQLQEIFARNTLLFVGSPVQNFNLNGSIVSYPYTVYAAPDVLIRFGFSWDLVN